MQVTLYTRAGCHLCEQARSLLLRAARNHPLDLVPVDVDSEPDLQHRYGERVPVVRVGDAELDWPFSIDHVKRLLRGGARP